MGEIVLLAASMNEGYQQFVNKAHEWACGIYKGFPGALVPKVTDAGYKLIWDDLCYEPPPSNLPGLPPPPSSPFKGGQCCNIEYTVVIRSVWNNGNPTTEVPYPKSFQGTILGIFNAYVGQGNDRELVSDLKYKKCDGRILSERIASQDADAPQLTVTIVNVYTTYGVPDTCGDPPKAFPPAPPPPSGGYKSPPTVITNNDGDEYNFTFNLTPPTRERYPDEDLPPITINVGGDDNDLNFDIDFNFGGDISINRPGSSGGNLPSGFKYQFQNLGNGLGDLGGSVSKLEDDFYFENFPPPFQDTPEVEKEEKQVDGDGEEDENKEGLLGVLVELTKPPTDVQFGTPNVNFAGWLTFLVQGGYAPREPINFDRGYFEAPPGATGYALTFTKGAKGKVTVYSKKE